MSKKFLFSLSLLTISFGLVAGGANRTMDNLGMETEKLNPDPINTSELTAAKKYWGEVLSNGSMKRTREANGPTKEARAIKNQRTLGAYGYRTTTQIEKQELLIKPQN